MSVMNHLHSYLHHCHNQTSNCNFSKYTCSSAIATSFPPCIRSTQIPARPYFTEPLFLDHFDSFACACSDGTSSMTLNNTLLGQARSSVILSPYHWRSPKQKGKNEMKFGKMGKIGLKIRNTSKTSTIYSENNTLAP